MEIREQIWPDGWHEDESDPRLVRYWDGWEWTEHRRLNPETLHETPSLIAGASRGTGVTGRVAINAGIVMMSLAFTAALYTFMVFHRDPYSNDPLAEMAFITAFFLGPAAMGLVSTQLWRLERINRAADRHLVVIGFVLGIGGAFLMAEPAAWGITSSLSQSQILGSVASCAR